MYWQISLRGWMDWILWVWWKILCDKQWIAIEITRSREISGMLSCKSQNCGYSKITSYPYLSDELHLDSEMRQVFFKFSRTIKELPTLETLRVDPSEFFYSLAFIPDKYDGESIVSALAKFRECPQTLKVVRNGKNSTVWKIVSFG